MYDCLIIGSGVAGISAALTLKANGKSFLLFGKKNLSDKIEKAESVRNYPAFLGGTGKALAEALKTQLENEEIPVKEEKVNGVYALQNRFTLTTQSGGLYEGKTVILASGVESVKQIEGEDTFLGRGVSNCATCDGLLYKDKTIAVFCTSKGLEGEIEYLAKLAKKLYLIPMYKEVSVEGVEIVRKMPVKVVGERKVTGLIFPDGEIAIDGLFVLRESLAPASLVGGLLVEDGRVSVGRNMQTNLDGLFAAGDCTGRPYQYAKAAGEGNVAAHAVVEFLAKK